jgi:hypothetical protein
MLRASCAFCEEKRFLVLELVLDGAIPEKMVAAMSSERLRTFVERDISAAAITQPAFPCVSRG